MGIVSGRKFRFFIKSGWFAVICSCYPSGKWLYCMVFSQIITDSIGNRFIFAILAAVHLTLLFQLH
jgi:protein associated with RNAse G/E